MNRCLQIAKNNLGGASPNPMVGCLIVHDNKVIGEGYTSKYGGNHAEVNAINSVSDKSKLKRATLYVTLEPCSHHGNTPPCTDLIIKYGIPKVVIGSLDINPLVSGKGVLKLKRSKCEVTTGILEKKCRQHHRRFFTFHQKKRPYIILKWAQTIDRFIAPEYLKQNYNSPIGNTTNKEKCIKKPIWISSPLSRQLAHKWRTEEMAIMVGTKTVLQDNPSLTARLWKGQNPLRVILDRHGAIDHAHEVFNSKAKTLLISEKASKTQQTSNVDFELLRWNAEQLPVSEIGKLLHKKNVSSLIVEGGSKTLQAFIDQNAWDEIRVFTSDIKFVNGIKSPVFSGNLEEKKRIDKDLLTIYSNP